MSILFFSNFNFIIYVFSITKQRLPSQKPPPFIRYWNEYTSMARKCCTRFPEMHFVQNILVPRGLEVFKHFTAVLSEQNALGGQVDCYVPMHFDIHKPVECPWLSSVRCAFLPGGIHCRKRGQKLIVLQNWQSHMNPLTVFPTEVIFIALLLSNLTLKWSYFTKTQENLTRQYLSQKPPAFTTHWHEYTYCEFKCCRCVFPKTCFVRNILFS